MADTKSANKQIADLVKQYRADNPGVTIEKAFAAVRDANPALWTAYMQERTSGASTPPRAIGSQPGSAGAAMVRKVGAAMPANGQTKSMAEGAPRRLAEAREAWMLKHGVTGARGIAQADEALKLSDPKLYDDYAAYVDAQHTGTGTVRL